MKLNQVVNQADAVLIVLLIWITEAQNGLEGARQQGSSQFIKLPINKLLLVGAKKSYEENM